MPSSTSPSEAIHEGALPAGLRLTASDRPGQAQPVPTRDIPNRPWGTMAFIVAIVVLLLTVGWEMKMRSLGLVAGDVDDSIARWVETRAQASGKDKVILVSDSRLMFDTDLDRFSALTGKQPVQLGVVGSSALALLKDLAKDPSVNGLVLVGMADTSYFGEPGFAGLYLMEPHKYRLPSQRTRLWLGDALEKALAFPSKDYRLSTLLFRIDRGWRKGVFGPYEDVWKISTNDRRRAYVMWDRIETDPFLRAHATFVWNDFKADPGEPPFNVPKTLKESAKAVEAIRARGGDVIFLRPPSAARLRINEEQRIPKAEGWDSLLRLTHSEGIHADDFGPQPWVLPELSHLSAGCRTVYTDIYVRRLAGMTDRLRLRGDAPPPLSVQDCVDLPAGAPARRI
ncbi:hypothetical protein LZ518_09945 [Sphingomonas sp. RB56-2]|uniref:Uncharacterized protein n=1 Tax=Sphingomonas brevis TaxID=2908206 RepID=A0ABT0SAQ7_9SPHN|nr:hypothetical protein [Sphingomonas brevis]MCL6741452.1 hypothetical protein [Sphingomonas brevis]